MVGVEVKSRKSVLVSDSDMIWRESDKVDALFQPRQEPFIIFKERTLEALYKEFTSKIQFEANREMFERLKPRLLMDDRYRNKWVAVVNGELIGPSDDDSELSRLVDERYGNVPAYIGKIVEKKEVIELPPRELE